MVARLFFGQAFQGEVTDKFAALANMAANIQFAVVVNQHVFDDGQTQACTAGFLVAAGVRPVKAFCQPGNMHRVNADAGVPDRQVGAFTIGFPAHGYGAAGRCVLNGVENQVGKGAAQLTLVAFDPVALTDTDLEIMALIAADDLCIVTDLANQAVYVRYRVVERLLAGLDFGQQNQVGDQRFHT